jgi:hypothetical protein
MRRRWKRCHLDAPGRNALPSGCEDHCVLSDPVKTSSPDGRSLRLPGEPALPAALRELIGTYRALDHAASRWSAVSSVRCPAGCGLCCEAIVPECTETEAELVARWVMVNRATAVNGILDPPADRAAEPDPGMPPCLFYDRGQEAHCTIYPARPFLCRAFGFAGYRDKHGMVGYRLCVNMQTPPAFNGRRGGSWPSPGGGQHDDTTPRLTALPVPPPPVATDLRRRMPSEPGAGARSRRPSPEGGTSATAAGPRREY